MALNQVAAELAECGRLRAPFRDAAHILLLDLDLDRPGKKGAIPSGLGLDLRSSKKRNRDLRNDRCSEQCGVMTMAQNCRRGSHTSVRVKGGALPNRPSRASVPVIGDSPSARSRVTRSIMTPGSPRSCLISAATAEVSMATFLSTAARSRTLVRLPANFKVPRTLLRRSYGKIADLFPRANGHQVEDVRQTNPRPLDWSG